MKQKTRKTSTRSLFCTYRARRCSLLNLTKESSFKNASNRLAKLQLLSASKSRFVILVQGNMNWGPYAKAYEKNDHRHNIKNSKIYFLNSKLKTKSLSYLINKGN